jgi:hypothetical protein
MQKSLILSLVGIMISAQSLAADFTIQVSPANNSVSDVQVSSISSSKISGLGSFATKSSLLAADIPDLSATYALSSSLSSYVSNSSLSSSLSQYTKSNLLGSFALKSSLDYSEILNRPSLGSLASKSSLDVSDIPSILASKISDFSSAVQAVINSMTGLVKSLDSSSGAVINTVNTITSNHLANTSEETINSNTASTAIVITLPASSSMKGKRFHIYQASNSNYTQINAASGDLICGKSSIRLYGLNDTVEIQGDGLLGWLGLNNSCQKVVTANIAMGSGCSYSQEGNWISGCSQGPEGMGDCLCSLQPFYSGTPRCSMNSTDYSTSLGLALAARGIVSSGYLRFKSNYNGGGAWNAAGGQTDVICYANR